MGLLRLVGLRPPPVVEHHHHHASLFELGPPRAVDGRPICLWLGGLVVFTTAFELFEHKLHHAADETRRVIVEKVKGELTLMGFLGFALSMAEQLVDIPHEAKLSFEFAHTLLFFMALTSFGVCVGLLAGADAIKRRVHEVEGLDLDAICAGPFHEATQRGLPLRDWRNVARFIGLRRRFLSVEKLPLSVDFAAYFADATYEYVIELLEAPLCFKATLVAFCAAAAAAPVLPAVAGSLAARDEVRAYVAAAWAVLGAQAVVDASGRRRLARLERVAGLAGDGDLLRAARLDRDERSHPRARDVKRPAPPHDDHATAHRDGGDAVAATLVGCRALLFSLFLLRYARYPLRELPAGWTRARLYAACLAPLVLAWASLVDHVSRAVLVSAITDPKPELVDRALERANAAARDVAEYRSAFLAFWRGRPDRSEAALADFFEDACGAVAKPARRGLARRGLSRQLTGLAAKPTMSFDNFEVLLASLEETRVSKKFAERLFTEMATDAELDFDEFKSYLIGRGKFSAIGAHASDLFGTPPRAPTPDTPLASHESPRRVVALDFHEIPLARHGSESRIGDPSPRGSGVMVRG